MKKFAYRGHLFLQDGLSLWKMFAVPGQSYSRCTATTSPANTMDTMDVSLIRILMDGPEVSLKGSPTVSPITAALCCGLPFPP